MKESPRIKKIAVLGGGAAGFFGSIIAKIALPAAEVVLYEKTQQLLSKVRISGGGRCNVTHACFDPKILVQNYPRGAQALLGPFHRFQPQDTVNWFEERGVKLKVEDDGRMFPISDDSETIVSCLKDQATKSGVKICRGHKLDSLERQEDQYVLKFDNDAIAVCDRLLVATGSSPAMWQMMQSLGHTIVPPVPSLFTFRLPGSPLLELAGVTVLDVQVKMQGEALKQRGPLLITHWGFSGPAILKLSAWEARRWHACSYTAKIEVNWLGGMSLAEVRQELLTLKEMAAARFLGNEGPKTLPKSLWRQLVIRSGLSPDSRWSTLSTQALQKLAQEVHCSIFEVQGKSTHKDEFVTCGGVDLSEVNFKTMESKICPGIYFAGEVLNIDGVTGGFNFQNAWTTAWIAGNTMAQV